MIVIVLPKSTNINCVIKTHKLYLSLNKVTTKKWNTEE